MTKIDSHSKASTLWLDYKNGLKFYILKKVGNEAVAEDLSHEVLMRLYKSCCSGTEIKNVRSWIFQIAHNTTIDYFRKQKKFVNEVAETADLQETNSYQDALPFIQPLIMLLPDKYGIPLQLSDLDELKQSEVAQQLNLSVTATKSRIQRARKLLKEKVIECSNLEIDSKGRVTSLEIKPSCGPLQRPPKKTSK